jgi:hypothetical protein
LETGVGKGAAQTSASAFGRGVADVAPGIRRNNHDNRDPAEFVIGLEHSEHFPTGDAGKSRFDKDDRGSGESGAIVEEADAVEIIRRRFAVTDDAQFFGHAKAVHGVANDLAVVAVGSNV